MRILILLITSLLLFFSCNPDLDKRSSRRTDRLIYQTFEGSSYIGDKNYTVYLPNGYDENMVTRYQVLYMMDGQNLFADSLAYGGPGWGLDKVLDSLVASKSIPPTLVVGIENAGSCRFGEYMPEKVFAALEDSTKSKLAHRSECAVYSDNFLKFIVNELKPQIDGSFRTLSSAEHTRIGGSSMGGLISMYAICEYPAIFGGAMCMSTHWPVSLTNSTPEAGWALVDYLGKNLPIGKKWYFDRGTEHLDSAYKEFQTAADSLLKAQESLTSDTSLSLVFNGHGHNELFWNKRLPEALTFVLNQ